MPAQKAGLPLSSGCNRLVKQIGNIRLLQRAVKLSDVTFLVCLGNANRLPSAESDTQFS